MTSLPKHLWVVSDYETLSLVRVITTSRDSRITGDRSFRNPFDHELRMDFIFP